MSSTTPKDPEYQKAYREFRERLRRASDEAGLTQPKVCARMGKSTSFISKCELGERRLDYVELRKLAKIYRKPVSFFGPPPE